MASLHLREMRTHVLGSWKNVHYRFLALLAVIRAGFITANVDNGYALLSTLIPTTIALIVVQEMAVRMGAITGKGLSDLIREEFGLRMTLFTMLVLGLADLGNIPSEFAGLASRSHSAQGLVWLVIVRGRYKSVERVLLVLSVICVAYPV
jgi:Mn2+/Fe2+ NRAMP family transporter